MNADEIDGGALDGFGVKVVAVALITADPPVARSTPEPAMIGFMFPARPPKNATSSIQVISRIRIVKGLYKANQEDHSVKLVLELAETAHSRCQKPGLLLSIGPIFCHCSARRS